MAHTKALRPKGKSTSMVATAQRGQRECSASRQAAAAPAIMTRCSSLEGWLWIAQTRSRAQIMPTVMPTTYMPPMTSISSFA